MKLNVLKNNVPLDEVSVDTTDAHEMYEIYVGRSEDCHVQIDDPLISRHHFVLKNENSFWYCEKVSQLGVITLNGQLVSKNVIQNGDEIKCGIYSILVTDLSPVVVKQAAPEYIAPAVREVYEPEPLPQIKAEPALEPSLNLDEELESSAPESLEDTAIEDMNDLGSLDDLSSNEESSEGSSDFGSDLDDSNSLTPSDEYAAAESSDEFGSSLDGEDDTFGVATTDSDDNESTRVFKAFVKYQLVLFGEHAPYDRYSVDEEEIFIGRDTKKCQIVLDDPEVSSVHAVLKKSGNDVTLEDLNSSNGTILNAERINRAQLMTGDEFVIGSTSFTLEVKSDLLESESHRLMPVEANQVIETEEVEEEEILMEEGGDLNFSTEAVQEKSLFKRFQKDPAFRKKAIYVIAGLGLMFVLLYDPEEATVVKKDEKPKTEAVATAKTKPPLSKELENRRNVAYELGVNFFEQNKYFEALGQFQVVAEIDPEYKKIQSYLEQTKIGLKRLEELEAQRRAEEDRIKTKKMIEELLVKARQAVKDRQIPVAENYFSQITEKDPENIEVQQLKLELDTWQKEQERIALEKAAKEAARKKMVDALAPGKTYYLKKEWYRAILKLEEFLRIKGMDEDLIKDASDMLSDSKNQLASDLGPLLGKARSLKEGQDLKSAYEAFLDVLKIEPTNSEALNEVDDIKTQLDARSKRIYREAIIAESLSLFNDAKEKFQEVQQISPTDSDYYKKASEKLKNYLE